MAMKHNGQKTILPTRVKIRQISRSSGFSDTLFSNITLFFTVIMVGILVALVFVLARDAMPAINKFGFSFFTSTAVEPGKRYLWCPAGNLRYVVKLVYRAYYRRSHQLGSGYFPGRTGA